jgi:predicted MFS family arabinose efflux permease
VVGGVTGPIVDRWGYPVLFTVIASTWLIHTAIALTVEEQHLPAAPKERLGRPHAHAMLPQAFYLLLAANLLFSTGNSVGNMGRSLVMDLQGFTATAITLIAAIGSAIGLVLNPLLGYLSDRLNRHMLLILTYALGGLALAMVGLTTSLVGFSLIALLMAAAGAERAISSALVTDLVSPEALDCGMSFYDAARWIGGVLGFAGIGYAIQLLGLQYAYIATALLPILALALLLWMRQHEMRAKSQRVEVTGEIAP